MKRTPVQVASGDIQLCQHYIALAKENGDTSPYTLDEWLACLQRRIKANKSILEQYGALKGRPKSP